jgi:hypothetical protein
MKLRKYLKDRLGIIFVILLLDSIPLYYFYNNQCPKAISIIFLCLLATIVIVIGMYVDWRIISAFANRCAKAVTEEKQNSDKYDLYCKEIMKKRKD